MTYLQVVEKLHLRQVCLGACGIQSRSHKRGFIYLDVVHWQERRVSKRGLRRFLLLCAQRDRRLDPGFLNDERQWWWLYLYTDQRRADQWAWQLGVRFPVTLSLPERRTVALVPNLARTYPAIYAWARRAA